MSQGSVSTIGNEEQDRPDGASSAVRTDTALKAEPVTISKTRDVTVVEVGPRDGLQNESKQVPTPVKIAFVDALSNAGLPVIESTSFVNPALVPQLSDAATVMTGIRRASGVRYPVLVPNERGLVRALEANVDAIALFTSATNAFAMANVGATIDDTFLRFAPVVAIARDQGLWVRGYVSVAFGCPYAGAVAPSSVVEVVERLAGLGCDEICLADTIGVAVPKAVQLVLQAVRHSFPTDRLALHFHDTTGNALLNVETALTADIRVFDSSAGGLGGCPFAPGAPGNLATEKLVDRLESLGLRTGVNGEVLGNVSAWIRSRIPGLRNSHL